MSKLKISDFLRLGFISSVTQLLVLVMVTGHIGTEARGFYVLIYFHCSIIAMVIRLGLDASIIREGRQRPAEKYDLLFHALYVSISLYVLLSLIYALIIYKFYPVSFWWIIFGIQIIILLETVGLFVGSLKLISDKGISYPLYICMTPIAQLVILIIVITLQERNINLTQFVLVVLFTHVGRLLLVYWIEKSDVRLQRLDKSVFFYQVLRRIHISAGTYLSSLIEFAQQRIDLVIVSALLSLSDLGVYSLALASERITVVGTAIANHRLSRASKTAETRLMKIVSLQVIFAVVVASLVIMTKGLFIKILPREFQEILEILPYFILAFGLTSSVKIIRADLLINYSQNMLIITSTIGLTASIIIGYPLISSLGLIGAGYSILLQSLIVTTFTVLLYMRVKSNG